MDGPIGIQVGADEDTVIYVGEAIIAILQEPRDEQTIQIALQVLQSGCRVENIDVTRNFIKMDKD